MVRETGVQSLVVITETQKMVLDASLLNTGHYKVRIKLPHQGVEEGVIPFPGLLHFTFDPYL